MTARDWRSAGRGYLEGKWRFVIDKHGGVDVYAPGSAPVDFPTQFVVKGRRLTAEDVPVCPGQTARYAWRVRRLPTSRVVPGPKRRLDVES